MDTFVIDHVKVWKKLLPLFVQMEAYTYFKVRRHGKEGRKSFLAVKGHYLGPNNVDHLALVAERKLHQLTYHT